MKAGIITVILLIISNFFMTAAWYGNLKLKEMHISTDWPLILVILASWGVAFIEYFFMIPANNIGSRINGGPFSLMQLKIIQEAISLTVFTVISVTVFNSEALQWNHIVAFGLIIGAVFFAFLK
ncbi:DMT family protein [Fibrobacter sp.]|uniref:DMT family protein n=1 Tax=Fibrobacter sp. TaxID=35828 RepID=UPI00388FE7FC